jgi:hypothetical protein
MGRCDASNAPRMPPFSNHSADHDLVARVHGKLPIHANVHDRDRAQRHGYPLAVTLGRGGELFLASLH